jgi:hypothetical protein
MKILIGCDVDPVLPVTLDHRPPGDVWATLDRISALLDALGNACPKITWLIRADQSVKFSTGSFVTGYTQQRSLWNKLRARGHELGWHMHTMSFCPSSKQFVFDASPIWLSHVYEQLSSCFPVKSTRTGWDYCDNALMTALDRLRISIDFSALPGNLLWFSAGGVHLKTDWRKCPRHPYRPSGNDYQGNGSDSLSIWEVPTAQFRRSPIGSAMRVGLRLRHGDISSSGVRNQTRLLTDNWPDLPLPGSEVWAFFFHPYDLTETGILSLKTNLLRLESLPNVEFETATEIVNWLTSREASS